jgi:hypothetical protein
MKFEGNLYELHIRLIRYKKDIEFFKNKLEISNNEEFKKTYQNNIDRLEADYNSLVSKIKENQLNIEY